MIRKELGKIKSFDIGACGYQDAAFGARIDLGGDGWGVGASIVGGWNTEPSSSSKWTDADRVKSIGEAFNRIRILMNEAKVEKAADMVGIPVECEFDGNALKNWRVLKEVL